MARTHAGAAAGESIHHERVDRENGEEVSAAPLHRGCQPEQQPGRHQPGPPPEGRPPILRPAIPRGQPGVEVAGAVAPVEQHERKPRSAKNIRKLSSSATRVSTMACPSIARRNAGDGRQRGRARTASARRGRARAQPGCRQGRVRSASRTLSRLRKRAMPSAMIHLPSGGCTTKSRSVVKAVDIARDELGFGAVGQARLVAQVQQGPRILHVIRLVEDERVRVPEIPEAQHAGQQGHGERAAPVPDRRPRRRAEHPRPPGVEAGADRLASSVRRASASAGGSRARPGWSQQW